MKENNTDAHGVSRVLFCWLCVAPILRWAAGIMGRLRAWTLEERHHGSRIHSPLSATHQAGVSNTAHGSRACSKLLGARGTPEMCLRGKVK